MSVRVLLSSNDWGNGIIVIGTGNGIIVIGTGNAIIVIGTACNGIIVIGTVNKNSSQRNKYMNTYFLIFFAYCKVKDR